jgi:hypothetical protein
VDKRVGQQIAMLSIIDEKRTAPKKMEDIIPNEAVG